MASQERHRQAAAAMGGCPLACGKHRVDIRSNCSFAGRGKMIGKNSTLSFSNDDGETWEKIDFGNFQLNVPKVRQEEESIMLPGILEFEATITIPSTKENLIFFELLFEKDGTLN